MTNDSKLVRVRHLESMASAAKDFTIFFHENNSSALRAQADSRGQQIDATYIKSISLNDGVLTLTKGDNSISTVPCGLAGSDSGPIILDTIPATVDGALWYEIEGGVPVIKIYYDAQTYSFYPRTADLSPNLALSPTAQTIDATQSASCTVSYLGSGNVSIFAQGANGTYYPDFNSSERTISLPYNLTEALGGAPVTITADLSPAPPYVNATDSCTVTMLPYLAIALVDEGDNFTLEGSAGNAYIIHFKESAQLKIKLLNRNPEEPVEARTSPYYESYAVYLHFDDATNVLTIDSGAVWENRTLTIENGTRQLSAIMRTAS